MSRGSQFLVRGGRWLREFVAPRFLVRGGSRGWCVEANGPAGPEADENVVAVDVRLFMMVDCFEEIGNTSLDDGLGLCMRAALVPLAIDVDGVGKVVGLRMGGFGHKLALMRRGLYVV